MSKIGLQVYRNIFATRLAVLVLLAMVGAYAAYILVISDIFSLPTTLAAFGGLAIGLMIEAFAGSTAAKRNTSNEYIGQSRKGYGPDHQALTAEYITVAAAVIRRISWSRDSDLSAEKSLEDFLYNASNLARNIVETNELVQQEVQLVLGTQRLLASYVLAPTAEKAEDLLPELMSHLGSLSLVGSIGDQAIEKIEIEGLSEVHHPELGPQLESISSQHSSQTSKEGVSKIGVTDQGAVLIIEDEAPVRAFASRALRLRGYEVLEAPDVDSAIRIIEDKDVEMDLVIFDHHLVANNPAFSSFKERLETLRPNVKKIVISHTAVTDDRIEDAEYLEKPVSNAGLLSAAERVLH